MTSWSLAFLALLPAFAIPALAALRGDTINRLAALPLAGAVASILLVVFPFVAGQRSFIDIALCLALLTLPGTLALAVFLERWL